MMKNLKTMKIGIMGFGRIGRDFFKLAQKNPKIDITAVVDLGKPEILNYLLNSDGIENPVHLEGNYLVSGNSQTRIVHAIQPSHVPWDAFDVDIVVDATHKYCSASQMQGHLDSGANRVIISALPRDEIDRIVVNGVNDHTISVDDKLISAGSSTTNALAIMLKIMSENFPLEYAMMTTVHAYTSDQPLQDTVGRSFRRSRSAAENIIPNTTPSPTCIEYILPEFKDKVEGIALNVPVPKGSCLDLTLIFKESSVTVEDVNNIMDRSAIDDPNLVGVTDDPIVSCDAIGNTKSLIFDKKATMKSSKNMIKVLCWYDNGLGHAQQIMDTVMAYYLLDQKGSKA